MAPLALPEMVVGENALHLHRSIRGDRKVRITHAGSSARRRSRRRPRRRPIYPPDGGEANGTDIVFQWTAADDPDGDAIGDYHFELSSRPDMRWPLSMYFYKLISRTADATKEKDKDGSEDKTIVKAQYSLSQPGLLTPDRRYYWHVRAMDDKGVWGPWSKTWSFIPRGPAYPLNVTLDYDQAKGAGMLRWTANPVGRRPVKYRVYGSDEKGFTIADQPFQGTVGVTKAEMAAWNPWFPANFIAETTATELAVMGREVDLARSQQDLLPRRGGGRPGQTQRAVRLRDRPPAHHLQQARGDRQGRQPYRYQVCANRSLGDLSARMKGNDQVSGYFDIEKPRFALDQGPAWLKIDEATGVLSGTPDAAGKQEVAVTTVIDRNVRKPGRESAGLGERKGPLNEHRTNGRGNPEIHHRSAIAPRQIAYETTGPPCSQLDDCPPGHFSLRRLAGAGADPPLVVEVWPDKAPEESANIGAERTRMSPKLDRKQVEVTEQTRLITDVTKPTLTIYRPAKEKDTETAMLICPGGGYWNLYWQLEGEEVAAWLNSIGVTGIILKYRVPRHPDEPKGEPARRPLQDAQRAVSLVRSKAKEWGVNPQRIGIVGFSAGGHLAIATATSFEKRTYAPMDDIDNISCRPDFAILVYPGYLKVKDKDELAPGLHIPAGNPPGLPGARRGGHHQPPGAQRADVPRIKAGRHSSGVARLCNGRPRFWRPSQRPSLLHAGRSLAPPGCAIRDS